MRSSGVGSAAGAALSWAAVVSSADGVTGGISAGSLISIIDLIMGGPVEGGRSSRSGSPCKGQGQPFAPYSSTSPARAPRATASARLPAPSFCNTDAT